MPSAYFVKHLSALRPADDEAKQILDAIKAGEAVEVTIKRKRNPRHHNKLFKLIELVRDNTDNRWPSNKALLDALKFACGHVDQFMTLDGEVHLLPASVSYASMDQIEFSKVYNQMVDVILAQILPNIGKVELEREVLQMIGIYDEGRRA